MVEWAVTETELRALDGDTRITFDTPQWYGTEGIQSAGSASRSISGSAAALEASGSLVLTTASGGPIGNATELPAGRYELSPPAVRCDGAIPPGGERGEAGNRTVTRRPEGTERVVLRFDGPADVRSTDRNLAIEFDERRSIAIGFDGRPSNSIVVPKTTEGIATALTHSASALRTIGPDRSQPVFRGQPPLVEFGDRVEIPDPIAATTPDSDLRFVLPDSIATTLVAAPLAYYLGATVEIEPGTDPVLVGPGFDRWFRALGTFQHDIAAMLRRVFLLDSLTRAIDPGEMTPAGGSPLERLGVQPSALAGMTPAERVRRYCEIPSAQLRPELPEWHLSTYVEPIPENALSLPYLLDDLGLIYLPSASELGGKGLLRRSLDDFYRTGEVASVDRLEPELHAGRAHGWLASGTPIDVFKTSRAAYEHRLAYGDRESPLDVTVVFNDEQMAGEHDRVASIYRERTTDLPANVTVETGLTTAELRDVFEQPNDFVHFIGHCDTDGLQCPDGGFSTASLEICRTRTFFLNACGSYHEGLELIEAGSVAGAVTLTAVLNEPAATVGTTFARLLIHGFDIERAITLARRRIMMGKDYTVVGDGTHRLTGRGGDPPAVVWLEERDDRYHLTYEVVETGTTGGTYRPPCSRDGRAYPHGVNADLDLGRTDLMAFLDRATIPVIHNGDFHWSTALAERLDE
jgi:hypothetical protein